MKKRFEHLVPRMRALQKRGLSDRAIGREVGCLHTTVRLYLNDEARSANREAMRRRSRRLKAEGLCQGCGERPAIKGKTLCAPCAEKQREASRRYRRKLKAEGLCQGCESPAIKGKTLCAPCAEKSREANRKSRRRRRADRKREGLCQGCESPAIKGKTLCAPCAEKSREAALATREKWVADRRCYRCGKPRATGDDWKCAACAEQSRLHGRGDVHLEFGGQCGACGPTAEALQIGHLWGRPLELPLHYLVTFDVCAPCNYSMGAGALYVDWDPPAEAPVREVLSRADVRLLMDRQTPDGPAVRRLLERLPPDDRKAAKLAS